MTSSKINVKFFLPEGAEVREDQVVPAFHSWIQSHAVAGHMLIDVADYGHVHHGPGVVLVSHEANFYLDHTGGRIGLLYQRKQPLEGDLPRRIGQAIEAALGACALLESTPALGGARFDRRRVQIQFNDRLNAPNTPQMAAELAPAVAAAAGQALGGQAATTVKDAPRELLTVTATV